MYVLPLKKHILPVNALLAIKGDSVLIELPREVDLRELDRVFYMRGGGLNLIDWEKTSFLMT